MEGERLLLFTSFGLCLAEWVLLPSVLPKQDDNEKISYSLPVKNLSTLSEEYCPDFHNLTTLGYGTILTERIRRQSDWEISYDDIDHLIKQNEKLPKTSGEMVEYVKQMGSNLMVEAEFTATPETMARSPSDVTDFVLREKQLKELFLPPREARTKYIDFPSMESALLTIAMLLFGVYLSKLILKLLLSHYNRFNGGVMMTGIRTPIATPMGRRRRSLQLQNINIMNLIDNYNSQFN